MNLRFGIAVGVVVVAVGLMMFTAARQTAKPVVTVQELVTEGVARTNVRLGARVADAPISVEKGTVLFSANDIVAADSVGPIGIAYVGALPDTLRSGRDVILEGDFNPGLKRFSARVLQTQCPSKYVPPSGVDGGDGKGGYGAETAQGGQ